MRARTLVALMAVLLFAWPVAAQDQRGSLEGTVKDMSGAVLPGVTVEARSATGVTVSTTTDAQGVYRFPSVAPGMYEVSATLASFSPQKVGEVAVALGQIKRVDFALSLASVTEAVQVTAESPLVDVKQNARQTNIRAEAIELLPKGRDFTSLVTQAPGANSESKLGGLSIDGASAGENRYIIDGMETTDIQDGTSGQGLIADFLDEVQVKSSGYTAEFGGATGGVINAVTKSGTNNWRGSVLFNIQGSNLAGNRRPTLRSSLTDPANVYEYVDYPKDDETRIEPGFSLGGPIATNRAWFFGAYQPALTSIDRSVTPQTAANPSASTFNEDQKLQVQYMTGNITSQLGNDLRARVSYNNAWSETEGLLPSLAGTDAASTNFAKTTAFPAWTLSGSLDWTASPKVFFGFRGGYRFSDIVDSNVSEEVRTIFSTGTNIGLPGVPAALQQPNGFQTVLNNSKSIRDQQTRVYFQADANVYQNFAGQHQLKVGFQVDRLGNNVLSGESANLVRLRFNQLLDATDPTSRGVYGYYQVRSNGVNPKQGFITEGNVHQNVLGLFIQDAWTINNRLTLNLGIRTEQEKVPTFSTQPGLPENGIEFNFGDKIAPRLGFAYDIKGDGRTKAFGSWGIFYDIFKLELPRGSFGGDKWLEYYYALDNPDWRNLTASPSCPPACDGRLLRGPIDFRFVSLDADHIDPDLKPMRQQEMAFGVEHQVNDVIALGVRYVHKQVDTAIEDTGTLDANNNEIYIIANPGQGLALNAFPGVPLPEAVRDYDSVEFTFDKRFRDNWMFRTSYLWSRLWGNYSGLSQSDENGRTSPNVGRLWDYPTMMFQDGGDAALGPLATDRPHQLKINAAYVFGFGTSIGVNQYVASGLPVSREIGIYPPNNLPVNYLGRLSDGRTDVFSQTDLLVQHEIRFLGERRLQFSFNVLNLFDQEAAVSKFSTYHYNSGVTPNEALFYAGTQTLEQLITSQNVARDPRFLQANGFQAPLQARFGVKFLF